jgi:hypothetical protein
MLRSLWQFSITFADSAILILFVRKVPALIIFLYKLSTNLLVFSLEPEVIFFIVVKLFFLSPGLILSGE